MTTNKLCHVALLLLCTMAVITFSSSCAEKEEILLAEAQPEEPPTLQPDWADGVITITIGRFETKEEMLQELYSSGLLKIDVPHIKDIILKENFTITPPEKRYSVNITVVTMLEAGITKPAALKEVREAYQEKGYGPLTEEETIELFLQFKDQPNSATGHRMNNFLVLLSKKANFGVPSYYLIQHNKVT